MGGEVLEVLEASLEAALDDVGELEALEDFALPVGGFGIGELVEGGFLVELEGTQACGEGGEVLITVEHLEVGADLSQLVDIEETGGGEGEQKEDEAEEDLGGEGEFEGSHAFLR